MSETEQAMVIERMTQLEENDRAFIMGVIAGLAAKQEQQTSSVSCADTTRACRPVLRSDRATGAICGTLRTPEGEGTTGCCGRCGGGEKEEDE